MQNKFDEMSLEEQALLAKIKEILGENSDEEVDENRAKNAIKFLGDLGTKAKDSFSRMRQGWNQTRSGASNVEGPTLPPLGRAGNVGQAAAQAATKAGQVGSAAVKGTAELGKGAFNATKGTAKLIKNNPKLAATLGAGAIGAYGYNKAGGADGIGKWADDKKKGWDDWWNTKTNTDEPETANGGANDPSGAASDSSAGGGPSGGPVDQQAGPEDGNSQGGNSAEDEGPGLQRWLDNQMNGRQRQSDLAELESLMKEISTYTDMPDAVSLNKEYQEFMKKMPANTGGVSTGSQIGSTLGKAGKAAAGQITDFASSFGRELFKEDVEVTRILKNSGIK